MDGGLGFKQAESAGEKDMLKRKIEEYIARVELLRATDQLHKHTCNLEPKPELEPEPEPNIYIYKEYYVS